MFLVGTHPVGESWQNCSLSQQQSPVMSHISSHQQSPAEPPPHLPAQLPAELHCGGEVVAVVFRIGMVLLAATSGPSLASKVGLDVGNVVVSILAMVVGCCLLTQPSCVSLHCVSLSQQQSPESSQSSSHQQEDLEPLPHWPWQLPAVLHSTGKVVFMPPTVRASTGGRTGIFSVVVVIIVLAYSLSFIGSIDSLQGTL